MTTVQEDFDRIAALPEESWNHNNHYHNFLLRQLPEHCQNALDIGCGTGAFARRLAERAEQVTGIDFSVGMIQAARRQSAAYPNIEVRQVDILACDFPANSFDCMASIATFHHLPVEAVLEKIALWLKPGGVLVILDLVRAHNLFSFLPSLLALPLSMAYKLVKTGRLGESEEHKAAWRAHGPKDHYLTLPEARRIYASALPGARVRKHLFWRYSVVWNKPASEKLSANSR